jgi:hypothetical protein
MKTIIKFGLAIPLLFSSIFSKENSFDHNSEKLIPVFTQTAVEEIQKGGLARALCCIRGNPLRGSGVLVQHKGHVFVLTNAHITDPKWVQFSGSMGVEKNPNMDRNAYAVLSAYSFPLTDQNLFVQTDIQLIKLRSYPDIPPLKLDSAIDLNQPLIQYGFGQIYGEFHKGELTIDQPETWGQFLPSKNILDTFEVDPKMSFVERYWEGIHQDYPSYKKWWEETLGVPTSFSNIKIDALTGRSKGLIQAFSSYAPEKGVTVFSLGCSGGPVIQNDKVVALKQSGGQSAVRYEGLKWEIGFQICQLIASCTLRSLGSNYPKAVAFAPWLAMWPVTLCNKLAKISFNKSLSDGMLWRSIYGYHAIAMLYKFYSLHTIDKGIKTGMIHITPEIIAWIEETLQIEKKD